MPYPFTLPTISSVDFAAHYHSPVYPALPLLVTTHRGTLRNLLKAHKRLPLAQQPAHLPALQRALEAYLPHLLFLQDSIHSGDVLPVDGAGPLACAWRATLTPPPFPGHDAPQPARVGLEYEVAWALQALAYAHTLAARSLQLGVLAPARGQARPRAASQAALNESIRHLLAAAAVHAHALAQPPPPTAQDWPVDVAPGTVRALLGLALADATLLAVTKQDPFPTYLTLTTTTTARGGAAPASRDWLYDPPAPPTGVKAQLLARICIAAEAHAQHARAVLDPARLPDELPRYLACLAQTARAKACRFLGIDAEAGGRVGEGIGWIVLARQALGKDALPASGMLARGMEKRKEKEEAKRMEEGGDWGADAGRGEEARTCAGLEEQWRRENERVFFQTVVDEAELAGRVPTGRECHKVPEWEPPRLGAEEVKALRGRVEVEALEEEVAAMKLGEKKEKASTVGYY